MDETTFKKEGYQKFGLSKAYVEEVHSRITAPNGKVYRGEAGRTLKKKMLEKQAYYERNK